VVMVIGLTIVVPNKATVPIPLSIVTLVAPLTLQLKVEISPPVINGGSAEKELIIGAVGDAPVHPAINTKTAMAKNKLKYLE